MLLLSGVVMVTFLTGGSDGVRVQSWEQDKRSSSPLLDISVPTQGHHNLVPTPPRNYVPPFLMPPPRAQQLPLLEPHEQSASSGNYSQNIFIKHHQNNF